MNKKIVLAIAVLLCVIAATGAMLVGRLANNPIDEPVNLHDNLVGGDRDEHGCIPSAGYSWCEELGKCVRLWEEPCVVEGDQDDASVLRTQITDRLIAKHGESVKSLDINISELSGNYAKGSAFEEGFGGGMWFAAKVGDDWQLVWDGNGIITCESFEAFPDFPSSLVPECYDEARGEMVER